MEQESNPIKASFIEHIQFQIKTLEDAVEKMRFELIEKERQIQALKQQLGN